MLLKDHTLRDKQWISLACLTLLAALSPAAAQQAAPPAGWPQFRGPARDGRIDADRAADIAASWPSGGPKLLWSRALTGEGYSGPAVYDGKVYINDYDPKTSEWIVRCLSLGDGQQQWTWSYRRRIRKNHGMTRTVPATDGRYVYSLDPKSVLHCLDAATGKQLWEKNLVPEYGANIPPWYNGQCPLLDGGRLILGIGGKDVLVAAFNPDGTTAWTTPNPDGHMMSHSSVMPAEIDGVRQYIWCTLKGLVSVAADDGRLLWSFDGWTPNVAVAPSALPLGDGKVFMSAGYKAGAVMIQVARTDGGWTVKELFRRGEEQFNTDTQTGVQLDAETIIAVDHFDRAGRLAALATDGTLLWRRDDLSFGLGNFILAGNRLLIMDGDSGTLRMIRVSRDGWEDLAAAEVAGGHEVWAPMAYVDGKLLVRNLEMLYCLDISAGE